MNRDAEVADFTQRQREKWTSVALTWFNASPPAVPSPEDLDLLRNHLLTGVESVLILGVTPGLRSVCQSLNGINTVLLADFSEEMLAASAAALPLSPAERWVPANWTELPLLSSSVDAVIGDKAIDNVHPARWRQLLAECRRILRPNGHAYLHVGLTFTVEEGWTFEGALSKWAALVGDVGMSVSCAGLWEELLSSSAANSEAVTLSLRRFLPDIARMRDEPRYRALIKSFELEYGETFQQEWANVTLAALSSAARDASLQISALEYSSDYDASFMQPLVSLVPMWSSGLPELLNLEEMARLEAAGIWKEIVIVSDDLSLDTSGEFRDVVLASMRKGVRYKYVVPESISVLESLNRMAQGAEGRMAVVVLPDDVFGQIPHANCEKLLYLAMDELGDASLMYEQVRPGVRLFRGSDAYSLGEILARV